jgi:hypothetical protein
VRRGSLLSTAPSDKFPRKINADARSNIGRSYHVFVSQQRSDPPPPPPQSVRTFGHPTGRRSTVSWLAASGLPWPPAPCAGNARCCRAGRVRALSSRAERFASFGTVGQLLHATLCRRQVPLVPMGCRWFTSSPSPCSGLLVAACRRGPCVRSGHITLCVGRRVKGQRCGHFQ